MGKDKQIDLWENWMRSGGFGWALVVLIVQQEPQQQGGKQGGGRHGGKCQLLKPWQSKMGNSAVPWEKSKGLRVRGLKFLFTANILSKAWAHSAERLCRESWEEQGAVRQKKVLSLEQWLAGICNWMNSWGKRGETWKQSLTQEEMVIKDWSTQSGWLREVPKTCWWSL